MAKDPNSIASVRNAMQFGCSDILRLSLYICVYLIGQTGNLLAITSIKNSIDL